MGLGIGMARPAFAAWVLWIMVITASCGSGEVAARDAGGSVDAGGAVDSRIDAVTSVDDCLAIIDRFEAEAATVDRSCARSEDCREAGGTVGPYQCECQELLPSYGVNATSYVNSVAADLEARFRAECVGRFEFGSGLPKVCDLGPPDISCDHGICNQRAREDCFCMCPPPPDAASDAPGPVDAGPADGAPADAAGG